MNLTCFYCQTPFTLSMDQKIAALRKMHAENLHHYDAHCPRCGRANAISRERLEMFTPGWEEAIKEPVATPAMAAVVPAGMEQPNTQVPSPVPAKEPSAMPSNRMRRGPARKRHAPAAKKAAKKPAAKKAVAKKTAKKATKKAATKKKTAA